MAAATSVFTISAEEYEQIVKAVLDAAARQKGLLDYLSSHLDAITAADGDYTFDVTVRFRALGGDHLVLIECKRHKNKVKRELVMVLHSKLQAVGGNKGMLFSTAGFQSGAVDYASKHGISLVQLDERTTEWVHRGDAAAAAPTAIAPSLFCGFWLYEADDLVPLSGDRQLDIRESLWLAGA
jgi:restriction system protein